MEKESSHLTDYLAHVLFVIAQSYCGAFLILLLGPIFFFLSATGLTIGALLSSFPTFWTHTPKDAAGLLVAAVLAYPIGLLAAEFFYRVGRRLRLHNDLNLETTGRDATEEEQIQFFREKCQIQEQPAFARIWEWENFQSAVMFYSEYISLSFTILYSVSLIVAFFHPEPASVGGRSWILAGALEVFSILFYAVMRQARIGKYESFRFANRAIKQILREVSDERTTATQTLDSANRIRGDAGPADNSPMTESIEEVGFAIIQPRE